MHRTRSLTLVSFLLFHTNCSLLFSSEPNSGRGDGGHRDGRSGDADSKDAIAGDATPAPVEITPTKSEGSDTEFGFSMALSRDGNLLVVGAPGESGGDRTGAVYVFEREAGGWSQRQRLTPTQGTFRFGHSVALTESQTIVVGAPQGNSSKLTSFVLVSDWDLRATQPGTGIGTSLAGNEDSPVVIAGLPTENNGAGQARTVACAASCKTTATVFPINDDKDFGKQVAIYSGPISRYYLVLSQHKVTSFTTGANRDELPLAPEVPSAMAVASHPASVLALALPTSNQVRIYGLTETMTNDSLQFGLVTTFNAGIGLNGFGTSLAMGSSGQSIVIGSSGENDAGVAELYLTSPDSSSVQSQPALALGNPNDRLGSAVVVSECTGEVFLGAPGREAVLIVERPELTNLCQR